MALYAIGDLHLSSTTEKPMSIFGSRWEGHTEKLRAAFSALGEDDLTVLCGDLSWGMDFDDTLEDFRFVDALPGKKIVLKGNHDYWWNTVTKLNRFFAEKDIKSIEILNNNCFFYDDRAICGTRGWFYEEETGSAHDRKILDRELGRLKASLDAAGDREKLVFLHYPPKFGDYECPEILELLEQYGVSACYYGHLHGKSLKKAFEGQLRGTSFHCVSADHVDFTPQLINKQQ